MAQARAIDAEVLALGDQRVALGTNVAAEPGRPLVEELSLVLPGYTTGLTTPDLHSAKEMLEALGKPGKN